MKKINAICLLFFFCLRVIFAEEAPQFFNQTDSFRRAHVGIYVVDMETQKEVYSSNAEQFFVPASLQKIPTSVAAISTLGEEYRFKTEVDYEGKIDRKGVLHGNVWIRGGGDPTLSLEIISQWEKELKNLGIHKIDGKILVDLSCFETIRASPHWNFEDLGNYYGAGASALTINHNLYQITFQPGKKEGDPASVLKIDPEIPDLVIHNEVITGPAGSGDQVTVFGSEYSPLQFYRGSVPIDQPMFTIKGAMYDPPLFCAQSLSRKIEASQGVEILYKKGVQRSKRQLAFRRESPPLKDIIWEMNHYSSNLHAEHLLKVIGLGIARRGAKTVEQFLTNLSIPAQVRDGSGLSRTNLVTPKGFTFLLCHIRKSPFYRSIYDSFPEMDNTLLPMGITALRAKTGSMSNIHNLGGYLTLASGKEYAFSIFCNNYQGSLKEIKNEMYRFLSWVQSLPSD